MFLLLTLLIAVVSAAGFFWALFRLRDPFHPLAYLGPMAAFIYVYLPLRLDDQGVLAAYFQPPDLVYVQLLNFLCVTALLLGCVCGTSRRWHHGASRRVSPNEQTLRGVGLFLGLVALLTYGYNIWNVGGVFEAYGVPKGGGTASSGYLRDFFYLAIPAVGLMLLNGRGRHAPKTDLVWVAVFALPFLVHGLLATRRGPTFTILVALVVGWYLTRKRRPRPLIAVVGGAVLGVLLLGLVSFREHVYLGSSYFGTNPITVSSIFRAIDDHLYKQVYGNEFFYGTNVVIRRKQDRNFYWGKRYATVVFVRPVPRQFWPTKYEDVGMADLLRNVGTAYEAAGAVPASPLGAAPGFVADLYVEFSWAALVLALGIGWLFGFAWKRAVAASELWLVIYICLTAVSIHLVAQTVIAILSKVLIMLVPTMVMWYVFVRKRPGRIVDHFAAMDVDCAEERVGTSYRLHRLATDRR